MPAWSTADKTGRRRPHHYPIREDTNMPFVMNSRRVLYRDSSPIVLGASKVPVSHYHAGEPRRVPFVVKAV